MNPTAPQPADPAAMLGQALAGAEAPPWPAPAVAELAAAFPELTVHDRIGQGGMAAVYHATQVRLGRPVALKVMRPDLQKEPQFGERFLREAKALATLSNPHVLAIHDFGERAGFCYLVTEYVDGANLRELMQLGRLSPDEVLRIVPQICAGLHFAHQHGVVHRDIKPENVLVDRLGQVKLADFGLAKLAGMPGPALTRSSMVLGTPHYMAPEQWHGSAGVDHRADIYSLGVVLYELLTGKLPVGTYAPASAQPGVPPGVDQVVQRSLQQEPELRYQSARDVQDALERHRSSWKSTVTEPASSASRGFGTWWLKLAACAVLLLGGATVYCFHLREGRLVGLKRSLRSVDEDNWRLLASIRETTDAGRPWAGRMPTPIPDLEVRTLAEGVRTTVTAGGALATLLAAMTLALAATRRTRLTVDSRSAHVATNLAKATPIVVPSAALLAWFPALETEQGRAFSPEWMTAFCGIGFGLVAWLSYRSGRSRPIEQSAPFGPIAKVALALSGALVAYCGALLATAERRPAYRPEVPLPVAAKHLVGLSRAQVLERLGPPLGITTQLGGNAGAWMVWVYRGLDGQERTDGLQFENGIVTTSQHLGAPLVPTPRPANGACVGMTVAELVAVLGPATKSSTGESGSGLEFADGTSASISSDGIVLRVAK